MDIASLSMAMSQTRVQESASIAVMGMAMDAGKQNATQMTEMISNLAVDPNLGKHIDISV
ncbi:YjfB family protein [Clostridium sp. C2-6-12]|uniref:YjfB family protein n=1 Tax=Clostridium sp. C2-6-12 TaxID=2698832 RepID=UPI00136ABFF7|nr:YjfB family protein [Clostridium sp. C2-6-12]